MVGEISFSSIIFFKLSAFTVRLYSEYFFRTFKFCACTGYNAEKKMLIIIVCILIRFIILSNILLLLLMKLNTKALKQAIFPARLPYNLFFPCIIVLLCVICSCHNKTIAPPQHE